MQKQKMTRMFTLAAIANFFRPPSRPRTTTTSTSTVPAVEMTFDYNRGTAGPYGISIVGTKRYRRYKLRRNKVARAANGGTLPIKFKRVK